MERVTQQIVEITRAGSIREAQTYLEGEIIAGVVILSDMERELGITRPEPAPRDWWHNAHMMARTKTFWISLGVRTALFVSIAIMGGQVWQLTSAWLVFGIVAGALMSAVLGCLLSAITNKAAIITFNLLAGICAGISSACQIGFPAWASPMIVGLPVASLVTNWESDRARLLLVRAGPTESSQARIERIIDKVVMQAIRNRDLLIQV